MSKKYLHANAMFAALEAAGICDTSTQRVVIDIQAGAIPIIYIQKLADERLLNVIPTLEGVEIRVVELPEPSESQSAPEINRDKLDW